jgi:hypothetical protein
VESFYGPGAEDFDEEKLLARRIQVTKYLVALSQLCESAHRGKRVQWDTDDNSDQTKSEEPLCVENETLVCPMNVCILCYGLPRDSPSHPPPHQFPSKRLDSLRRHLFDSHLALVRDGISCNWSFCRDVPKFKEINGFLAHAVNVHAYDVHIKLQHLPKRPMPSCSGTLSVDSAEALESDNVSRTDTPLSSLDSETANIDPRLWDS